MRTFCFLTGRARLRSPQVCSRPIHPIFPSFSRRQAMAKRKRSGHAAMAAEPAETMPPPPLASARVPPPPRRTSSRVAKVAMDPDESPEVVEGVLARLASPDEQPNGLAQTDMRGSESPLSDPPPLREPLSNRKARRAAVVETSAAPATPARRPAASNIDDIEMLGDPEVGGEEEASEDEIQQALSRRPPVNSAYLPLPWKGRLGYACLNTYLRYSHPPVFSSRTCRIASILEHRHPLADPSQPEHSTKNRPDKNKPADVALGQQWVESLGLQNARDIIKMLRWNDKYGIKFMRLSSEMFPFASHDLYGYKLAPFASQTLAEVGKVVAELGHRVTTHPGQFTQLGSPRKQVVENAIRDLQYHDEMLTLLKLPPQQDRDAVMILHMGGVFGSKPETISRFKENYAKLSPSIKNRLVLENDDVSWSVHDLLPVCQELNIPLVLDYHHHNIIFDETKLREGTQDIMDLYPVIRETWTRKGITQKMHYSEPCPGAITARQRRKHSPRVMTLPPCAPDMDLMIEAKDKEQAVFELMRTFKLPGFETINDLTPYSRSDDNRLLEKNRGRKKATPKKKRAKKAAEMVDEMDYAATDSAPEVEKMPVPEDEIGMGGPEARVYWPPGMEEWLRPKKREVKKKAPGAGDSKPKTPRKSAAKATEAQLDAEAILNHEATPHTGKKMLVDAASVKGVKPARVKGKKQKTAPTPSTSDDDRSDLDMDTELEDRPPPQKSRKAPPRTSKRAGRISYAEAEAGSD